MRSLEFGIWNIEYSVISCFTAWVKNVNKLRTNSSKNSVKSSPVRVNTIATHALTDVQLPVIHPAVHLFTQHLSTLEICSLHPLFTGFPYYPHPLLLEPLKKI